MKKIISAKYFWPSLFTDVSEFLQSCALCYTKNSNIFTHYKNKMKLFPATRPFQTVHLDLVGPFDETEDGYKYILSMCDRLTRLVELVPLRNMTAQTVVQAFIQKWICTYGVPEHTITDQGSQFESEIFKTLCQTLNIKKQRTTAYRPQTNGILERMHREIKKHLRAIALQNGLHFAKVSEDKDFVDDWSSYLDLIKFRLNSSISPATGYSPLQLIFGYQPRLPEDFAWEFIPSNPKITNKGKVVKKHYTDYVNWLKNVKDIMVSEALSVQNLYDEQRKRQYDNRIHHEPNFSVGDFVTFKIHTASKIEPQQSEPYLIISIQDDVCTIQHPTDKTTKRINSANLYYAFPLISVSKKKRNKRKRKLSDVENLQQAENVDDGELPRKKQKLSAENNTNNISGLVCKFNKPKMSSSFVCNFPKTKSSVMKIRFH